jgi:ATP-dependent Clp protease ATP-binding subunit ClpX
MTTERNGDHYCDFCDKRQDEVDVLIAGPTPHICDECIELAQQRVDEVRAARSETAPANTETPHA